MIELFVQLFEGCNFERGFEVAFKVLRDQIFRYGLTNEEEQASNLNDQSTLESQYLMIRLCKQISKQITNSGLKAENELKT